MSARIIDGKAIAAKIRGEQKERILRLQQQHGVRPGLAVILVGRRSGLPGIRSQQGHRLQGRGDPLGAGRDAGERHPGSAAQPHRCAQQPIRPSTASWCSCRCRRRSMCTAFWSASISTRMSMASTCTTSAALVTGNTVFPPCTPYGVSKILDHEKILRSRVAMSWWSARQQYRRQADGTHAHAAGGDGVHLPQEDPRSG